MADDKGRKIADGSPGGVTSPKRTTSPHGVAIPKAPRLQSPTERELASEHARKERASSVHEAEEAPSEDFEDITGAHAIGQPERRLKRRKRSPSNRLDRLDDKADEHGEKLGALETKVGELDANVAGLGGKVDGLTGSIDRMLDHVSKRDIVAFTERTKIDSAKQITEIEKTAAIEVAEARSELKDAADAKAARRKVLWGVAKTALIALGAVVGHALLQKIGWMP